MLNFPMRVSSGRSTYGTTFSTGLRKSQPAIVAVAAATPEIRMNSRRDTIRSSEPSEKLTVTPPSSRERITISAPGSGME